jgi:gas vesicle protein
MSKKIILMWLAYFAWVAAAITYNKKNPEQISTELANVPKNPQDKLQVFWNNFVEIHKTFLENLKTKHLNDDQKALFEKKEQEVLEKFEEYKNKAKDIFQEYSLKWEEYSKEGSEKIDEVYKEVKSEITELKAKAPEKIDELQSKLNSFLDDLKERLKK